ncbi:hypothetical protein FHS96_002618 [Sphingomonas zeicaulis]|uniref:hypothetical protein n=1 Tax=Sphingomonas zeicaulis TaxID=1632740 RepID=UPI003D1AB0E2
MRHLVSKLMTASMVAGAALLVSACGGEKPAAETNTTTELNEADPMMDGTANDTMTDGDAMMNDSGNMMDSNMMAGNAM